MSRVNYRKAPGSGSQRHAKLGKRPTVDGSNTGTEAGHRATSHAGTGPVEASQVDNVKHKTFTNKSGNTENLTG